MSHRVSEASISEIGATADTLFEANPGRLYLSITNLHGSQDIFVRFGGTATTSAGRKIAAGATVTWGDNVLNAVPGGAVSVIGSGANTGLYAWEGIGKAVS